jgi:putative transposase
VARHPRLEAPGLTCHVIQRGNNRAACFVTDSDRYRYLDYLGNAAARFGCAVHAYVLMTNHVHLLLTPGRGGAIAAMMQDLGRRYVRVFNDIHERTGTLWEGRYKACLVDSERYLLACHRYIELNPLRAGMVEEPAAYPWSSHRHYARGTFSSVVTHHAVFDELGHDAAARCSAFIDLFGEALNGELLERIRTTVNQGWALGSDRFLEEAERMLGRSVRPPKRGRPRARKEIERQQPEMLI